MGPFVWPLVAMGASVISNLIQGKFNNDQASAASRANYEAQKEFAQHGIQWRVEDAQRAGLHPLVGAGSMGGSFSPSFQVGDTGYISNMGQDISRAAMAMHSPRERVLSAHERRMERYSEQTADMQLKLLKAQLDKMNAPGTGPGVDNMYIPYRRPDGSIVMLPSPEAAQGIHAKPLSSFFEEAREGLGPMFDSLQPAIDHLYNFGASRQRPWWN